MVVKFIIIILISYNKLNYNYLGEIMVSNNNINNVAEPVQRAGCVTIGRMAPDFYALSTLGYIRLSDYRGKWVIFFSQPMSYTPVSTSEIINASRYYPEFTKRNAQFISLTTDNVFANLNWVYDVYLKTGIHVPFPVIADSDKEISQLYGMMNIDRTYEESVRDAFIINPEGKIMAILTLPITCGRSGYELTRILDSLQLTANNNLYTPADWTLGDPVIVPPPANYEALINSVETSESSGLQCPLWYLCLQNTYTVEDKNATVQQNICPKKYKTQK